MYHSKSGQKRTKGFSHLQELYEDIARNGAEERGIVDHRIISCWDDIVGVKLARICRPERVLHKNWNKQGARLVLKVPKGFVQKVEMQREQIIERVNVAFGFGAVNGIVIEHTTFENFNLKKEAKVKNQPNQEQKEKIKEIVKDAENSELRELLYDLGLNVMAKTQIAEKK